MTENEIENVLRKAPRPAAPPGLKDQLVADIALTRAVRLSHPEPSFAAPLWRRWFPALSFGGLLLGCLIVMCVQTNQLLELRRENAALRSTTAGLDRVRQDNAELQRLRAVAQEAERAQKQLEELARLRAEVAQLRGAAQALPDLRAESQRLQAERAAAAAKAGVAVEVDPFAEAKGRADRIACINNVKQICLGARIWAKDHRDIMPADFLTMSNELNSPKVLTCPSDTARKPAANWQEFDGSSVSYELLSPGVPEGDPSIVLIRCPIHFNVGLLDGSAHQLNVKDARIEKVDGKFKIIRIQNPNQP
jgi:hypothetical protein